MTSDTDAICGLTFDWDNLSIHDDEVISALDSLLRGTLVLNEATGFPILIPIPMSVEKQMEYRIADKLECRGRRISDSYRKQVGMRTSRIFEIKNGRNTGMWEKWT